MMFIQTLIFAVFLGGQFVATGVQAERHGPVPTERARQAAERALRGLIDRSEAGDRNALFHIGQVYAMGELIPRDLTRAENYFLRYAGTDAGRANEIGEYYLSPLALPKRAVPWLERAVDGGNAMAYFNLGTLHRLGNGVTQNSDKAFQLFTTALSSGIRKAHAQLAIMYFNGEGRGSDYGKARRHFLASPDRHLHAVYLGQLYRRGLGGPVDPAEAEKWFLTAVNIYKSWPDPMAKLGDMHLHGEMPSATQEEALAWYLLATALGHDYSEKQVRALDNKFSREAASRAVKIASDYARAAKLPSKVISYLFRYKDHLSR